MTKTEVYNSDYTKLNHAYIVIYESYQKLVECKDADKEVLFVMEKLPEKKSQEENAQE